MNKIVSALIALFSLVIGIGLMMIAIKRRDNDLFNTGLGFMIMANQFAIMYGPSDKNEG